MLLSMSIDLMSMLGDFSSVPDDLDFSFYNGNDPYGKGKLLRW